MKAYILRVRTQGIKNLDKEVELNFYDQTISVGERINYKKGKVKAIYGYNGAGKTAIVTAVSIYKNLVEQPNYLIKAKQRLCKLINFDKKFFVFEGVLAAYGETKGGAKRVIGIFKHRIKVSIDQDNNPFIEEESFYRLTGKTINDDNFELIYKVDNGNVDFGKYDDSKVIEDLKSGSLNLSKANSLLNTTADYSLSSMNIFDKYSSTEEFEKIIVPILTYYACISGVRVYIAGNDNAPKVPEKYKAGMAKILNYIKKKNPAIYKIVGVNKDVFAIGSFQEHEDIVHKKDIKKYEQNINKMARFLEVFRTNLKIKIKKKIDGQYYHCEKIFSYDGYDVSDEYESTGIRNLMELFNYLKACSNGTITFIDDLDANINGIYLTKLVEYLIDLAEGQSCFTTHNFEPMNLLKNHKHSIDFLGVTGEIASWVKNGNYAPRNIYMEGMMRDSPANVDSYDFLPCFY